MAGKSASSGAVSASASASAGALSLANVGRPPAGLMSAEDRGSLGIISVQKQPERKPYHDNTSQRKPWYDSAYPNTLARGRSTAVSYRPAAQENNQDLTPIQQRFNSTGYGSSGSAYTDNPASRYGMAA